MTGDIDFIFEKNKVNEIEEILNDNGYKMLGEKENYFKNHRHMQRRIKRESFRY